MIVVVWIICFLLACIVFLYSIYQFSTQCAPIFRDIIVGVKSTNLKSGQYSTFLEEIDGSKINYHRHCIKCNIDGEEYTCYDDVSKNLSKKYIKIFLKLLTLAHFDVKIYQCAAQRG